MSIFDAFKSKAPAAPQPAEANPTVPNQSNTVQQQPTPQDPNPQSPNVNFGELWKMEPTQQPQAPNFKLDPQQLSQVSNNINFARAVNKDDLGKIVQGGEEAVGALMNVLNSVGREIFSTNAQFTSHMTESGYNTAQRAIDTGLPNLVKKQFTQNDLFQANPKLREPALQPLVMAIQSQISQKYPNASPTEVNSMVSQYFTEVVGKSFAPEEKPQSKQDNSFDFSSFLS